MRIHTRIEFVWSESEQDYLLVHEEGFDLPAGSPIALCKGPDAAEKDISQTQQDFYHTLVQDYGTTFGEQQQVLGSLTKSLTDTLDAGPSQNGFSAGEQGALNTLATSGTAKQYENARQAAGENVAAAGGNTLLPSGAVDQIKAENTNAAAAKESDQLLGIQEAGFQAGRDQYNRAASGLTQVASLERPNSEAPIAAGGQAFGSAEKIQQLNDAASPWNIAGGVLGAGAAIAGDFFGTGAKPPGTGTQASQDQSQGFQNMLGVNI